MSLCQHERGDRTACFTQADLPIAAVLHTPEQVADWLCDPVSEHAEQRQVLAGQEWVTVADTDDLARLWGANGGWLRHFHKLRHYTKLLVMRAVAGSLRGG
jgi:hypothetical protein